jgi:hypothetical protein
MKRVVAKMFTTYNSRSAHSVVVEDLGRELFKHQQESINNKQ